MTHDEIIEAVARAVDGVFNDAGLRGLLEHEGITPQSITRAAIRVIAPAVLEEAAVCAVMVGNHFDRIETQAAIRAMKTRYEQ